MAKQEVMTVNPSKRKNSKPKRRRRRNPSPARTSHRSNPKRRRRRNPSRGGGGGFLKGVNLRGDLGDGLWRMGGKLIAAWAVTKFGDAPEAQPGGPSPTTGDRWTIKNLAIAWAAGLVASQIGVRAVGQRQAQLLYNGAVDMVITKALWSEVVGRLPYGRSMFGDTEEQRVLAQTASTANEGDILEDGTGNRWLLQGGKWVAMQGVGMGALVEEGRLGALVEEGRLGAVVTSDSLGHIMTADQAGSPADQWGRATWRGSADPYAAAFM